MDNTNLIDKFMSKLTERSYMSIAADTGNYKSSIESRLKRKAGIHKGKWVGKETIDGEEFDVYKADDTYYGKDSEGKYWNLDARTTYVEDPLSPFKGYHPGVNTVTIPENEYQINSTLTDPKMLEFFDALDYLYSDDRNSFEQKRDEYHHSQRIKNDDQAKKAIKVEVIDGKFTDPYTYVGKTEEAERYYYAGETYSHVDDEAEFTVKVTVGSTPIFEGLINTIVYWGELSDTGISRDHIDGIELGLFEDSDGNQCHAKDLIDRIPASRFQDIFNWNGSRIIEDAIADYIASHCN